MGLNIPRPSGGQRVEVINPSVRPIPIALVDPDKLTYIEVSDGSLAVIDHSHDEIHKGNFFRFHYLATVNSGINVDALIIAPDLPFEWHFEGIISSTAGATVRFYEDVVTSDDGVGLTVFNANRQSTKTNTMNVHTAPTITDLGMEIEAVYLGAGNTLGALARSEDEWILKPNTKYLVRTTSNGNNNRITVRINWYEES